MTPATDALARVDEGVSLPGDRTLADIFDQHCRWGAQKVCLICGFEGQGSECDLCVIADEVEAKRSEDR
jgi:hypothetical protein